VTTATSDLHVGDRIWFDEEVRPYTIQARSLRFLVCTKPFAARHTVIYTVVDLLTLVRGTENLVFGFGAETREKCEEMLARLEGTAFGDGYRTEVSHRNRIALKICRSGAGVLRPIVA
jgi:hypothetical protein